ncbi:Hemolymph protein 14, partial [Operophtera brumata]
EYRCIVSGAVEGSRECGVYEPAGTFINPRCRRPTYYSPSPLPYMRCIGAAHCFWTDLTKQLPASMFAVAVGKLYRPWNDNMDQAQKSQVKVIHLPIRFQGASANFQDDIAVVIVAQEFQFKTNIRPESPVLQVVDLPYVDVGTCIYNSPPDYREYITSDKICAGTLEPAKFCDGTKDCADGTDETFDACAKLTCSHYLFRCKYGACIDKGATCNKRSAEAQPLAPTTMKKAANQVQHNKV